MPPFTNRTRAGAYGAGEAPPVTGGWGASWSHHIQRKLSDCASWCAQLPWDTQCATACRRVGARARVRERGDGVPKFRCALRTRGRINGRRRGEMGWSKSGRQRGRNGGNGAVAIHVIHLKVHRVPLGVLDWIHVQLSEPPSFPESASVPVPAGVSDRSPHTFTHRRMKASCLTRAHLPHRRPAPGATAHLPA